KLSWALRNFQLFPLDINKADLGMIMRVPGIGVGSARKIVSARKFGKITWESLMKFGIAMNRARNFIVCHGDIFSSKDWLPSQLKAHILDNTNSKFAANFLPQLTLV